MVKVVTIPWRVKRLPPNGKSGKEVASIFLKLPRWVSELGRQGKKQAQPLYLDLPLSLGWRLLFPGSGPFTYLPSGCSHGKRGSQGSTSKEANSKLHRSQAVNANVRWQVSDNQEQWGLWRITQCMAHSQRSQHHCDDPARHGCRYD